MTRVFVVPVIRREDYDAFRRDIGQNLADTYDEWAKLFADELAEARRQGKTVIEAIVHYDEFLAFCVANGHKPNPQILLDFAIRKRPVLEA